MKNNYRVEISQLLDQKKQKAALKKYITDNKIFVYSNIEYLWQYIVDKLDNITYITGTLDNDYEIELLKDIRTTYPELHKIEDYSLYILYDDYQSNCNLVSDYDVYREEAFVFYLICDLASIKVECPEDLLVGEAIASFLVKGEVIDRAKQKALNFRHFCHSHNVYCAG